MATLVVKQVEKLTSLRGIFKGGKKYSKKKARKGFIKDMVGRLKR